MTVVLTLLTIIGRMLLALLILVLLLVLFVLFVPVAYRACGKANGRQFSGRVRISWLFRLVSFQLRYEQDELSAYFRLFGFRVWSMKPDGDDASGKTEDEAPGKSEDVEENDEPDCSDVSEKTKKPDDQAGTLESNEANSDTDESDDSQKDTIINKIGHGKTAAAQKASGLQRTLHKWSHMFEDPINKAALAHIKRAAVQFLKCVMPSGLHLELSYSTGSPDTTAQLFGILAMFPVGYTNRWRIRPDFEADAAYADGTMDIRGHFMIIRLLWLLLGVFFDKNCRRLYRRIK